MKNKLLTTTAASALFAFGSTVASAEGFVLRGFGGLNFAGDEKLKGSLVTDRFSATYGTTKGSYIETTVDSFSGDFNFDSDTGIENEGRYRQGRRNQWNPEADPARRCAFTEKCSRGYLSIALRDR